MNTPITTSLPAAPPPTQPDRRLFAYLAMLIAVGIYGTNFAISRFGIKSGLTPFDLTFLRFAAASLVLLPVFLRAGLTTCAGIGWGRGLVLTVMSGVPMTLLMMTGLALAPAAHGAAIAPGTVTVIGAVGGAILFGVRPGRNVVAGIGIVILGLALFAIAGSKAEGRHILLGDLCFFGVGCIWGGYPLMLQLWKVDSLHATAVLSVLSLIIFTPIYLASGLSNLANVPIEAVVFHAFNQGILNLLVGLWLWGYAVKMIGAAESGRFPPLIPVIGALSAIPLLGEIPGPYQWAGIGLIVAGVALTTRRQAAKAPHEGAV